MIHKSTLVFDDVRNYNYQGVIAYQQLDNQTQSPTPSTSYNGCIKYLLVTSKVDNNNIININEVAIKYPDDKKEILFSNFSLTKAIEFYNNLK